MSEAECRGRCQGGQWASETSRKDRNQVTGGQGVRLRRQFSLASPQNPIAIETCQPRSCGRIRKQGIRISYESQVSLERVHLQHRAEKCGDHSSFIHRPTSAQSCSAGGEKRSPHRQREQGVRWVSDRPNSREERKETALSCPALKRFRYKHFSGIL